MQKKLVKAVRTKQFHVLLYHLVPHFHVLHFQRSRTLHCSRQRKFELCKRAQPRQQ